MRTSVTPNLSSHSSLARSPRVVGSQEQRPRVQADPPTRPRPARLLPLASFQDSPGGCRDEWVRGLVQLIDDMIHGLGDLVRRMPREVLGERLGAVFRPPYETCWPLGSARASEVVLYCGGLRREDTYRDIV
jgi:hypothetical protein